MKSPSIIAITLAAGLVISVIPALSRPASSPQNLQTGPLQVKPDPPKTNQEPKDAGSEPQPRKKLVLADGTFQIAREYTVTDDRVRYWSVERSAWEEIPSKLVDWDATRKAEADQVKQAEALRAKIHANEVADRTRDIDVDRSLEIKPGLFLPDSIGFYVVEDKLIFQLKQNLVTTRTDKGKEVIKILSGIPTRGQPIASGRQNLEIPGPRAGMRIQLKDVEFLPEFFMRPADEREPRFVLVQMQVKGDHRVVESIDSRATGEKTHHKQEIEFQTWTPARGVFRYTFNQHLDPGEYAFVEMMGEEIYEYVWDFGVDPPGTKPAK